MRRKLIEALTYPRLFVLENIGVENCPQDRLFDSSCDRCRSCDLREECQWLSCINNFADFANKPTHTIHASLLYGINLIKARNEQMQHNSKACTCESCNWTRDARELSQEFSRRFVWVFNTDQRAQQPQ